MSKAIKKRVRDPLSIPFRNLKRISITLETLLRAKLSLEQKSLSDPLPAEPTECIEYLRRVVEKSEQKSLQR